MTKLNKPIKTPAQRTYEGAIAAPITPIQMLRRSVLSCLLWEAEFYESGVTIADRIADLCKKVSPAEVMALAVEARSTFNLRHAPLLLLVSLMGTNAPGFADAIAATIQRPDELAEFLAIYWRKGRKPIPKQAKLGLARAFAKFDAYALAKWNRDGAIKLRDVMRLVHPKPADIEQELLWGQLNAGTLEAPDTWEVALSGGADKALTFTRLIEEGKLGYMALLRNLRNMANAGVDPALVKRAIIARKGGAERILPFRYVAAARAAPQYELALDHALLLAIKDMQPMPGLTHVLVDVSGSMGAKLSAKSDLSRMDAACALAAMVPGEVRMFSFSSKLVEVPPRRGMAGVDALRNSQSHGSTDLISALHALNLLPSPARLIVITDEQISGRGAYTDYMPKAYAGRRYLINVASARNGIGYGDGWQHIDGFSEAVLRYIAMSEAE